MKKAPSWILVLAAFATLGGTAACSSDAASRLAGTNGTGVPVTLRLASVTSTSTNTSGLLASSYTGPLSGDFSGSRGFGDYFDGRGHHWRGWWGWLYPQAVDSLIVDVTKVEVLAMTPDTEDTADSVADAATAASFGHDDDADSSRWEEHEWGWIQLDVTDGGHIDLLHLPDSTSAGISVASGTLPAGTYRHVRLFVTNPVIYFDTTLVTPAGDTLQADTGYAVTIPCADSTGAAIRTDERFVVPDGGGTVQLYFDGDDTVRHIVITGSGTIIVPPVIR